MAYSKEQVRWREILMRNLEEMQHWELSIWQRVQVAAGLAAVDTAIMGREDELSSRFFAFATGIVAGGSSEDSGSGQLPS